MTSLALCDLAIPPVAPASLMLAGMVVLACMPRSLYDRLAATDQVRKMLRPLAGAIAVVSLAIVLIYVTGTFDVCSE